MTKSEFWRGRRVLLTGHTGFKGAWAAAILCQMGAKVTGLSLAPQGENNAWRSFEGRLEMTSEVADLRDAGAINDICSRVRPQVVLHMAAQAQVRSSYSEPQETFASNVMGTVNLLDALRCAEDLQAVLVVTSDKVYRNDEAGRAFVEADALGGSDPYSASKAAVELVVNSYRESFFEPRSKRMATVRGGNVVGGGDFSSDRLLPDLFRAASFQTGLELRYPESRRPWQHVLDCLDGYFRYAERLATNAPGIPDALNIGPAVEANLTVAEIVDAFARQWGADIPWRLAEGNQPPEKKALMLDNSLALRSIGWSPTLDIETSIAWTAQWYAAFAAGADALELVRGQIGQYEALRR